MHSRLRELRALTSVRLKLFLREPEAVFWVVIFPLVLTIVLGFAFRSSTPGPSRVAVLGSDGEAVTSLADRLAASPNLEVERSVDEEEAGRQLRRGVVDAIVWPDSPPRVRSDKNRIEGELAQLRIVEALSDDGKVGQASVTRPDRGASRGGRYIDFLFFGVLGMNLMGTGIYGVAFGVADLRQKKLLRRLLVTPMRRASLMVSFMLSRLVFLAGEMVLLIAFGALALDVPMAGNMLELVLVCVVGGFAFSGIGLLVAARARTMEGVSGLTNVATLPMWLVSGVFFSYERFPEFFQLPIRLLPLTALNDALRAVMLDGQHLTELPLQCAVLLVWSVMPVALALKIFRWQ